MALFPENESASFGASNISRENIAGSLNFGNDATDSKLKDLGAPPEDLNSDGQLDPEGPCSNNIGC